MKPPIPPAGTAVEPTAHAPDADTLRDEAPRRAAERRCPRCGQPTDASRCPIDGAPTLAEGEPPDAALPTVGQRLCERYRLDRLLGRGAMGAVYAAYDLTLDRPVAVKLVRADRAAEPKVLERFHREAEALARLSHGAIVPLLDYGVEPTTHAPYTVLRLIDGPSLAAYVRAHGPVDEVRARRWLGTLAAALSHAHAHGVVHRDVKPENVLIEGDEARLTDFGLVKVSDAPPLTRVGARLGTPLYMAPEAAMGGRVDARADLYGLGCLLDVMLVGRPPFVAEDPWALLEAHVSEPPPPLPARLVDGQPPSAELCALRALLLAKSPSERPASAELVRAALERRVTPSVTAPPTAQDAGARAPAGVATLAPATRSVPPPTTRPPRGLRGVMIATLATAGAAALLIASLRGEVAPSDSVASPPPRPVAPEVPPLVAVPAVATPARAVATSTSGRADTAATARASGRSVAEVTPGPSRRAPPTPGPSAPPSGPTDAPSRTAANVPGRPASARPERRPADTTRPTHEPTPASTPSPVMPLW